ncbi:MAG: nucleotidyl transferase AbiEii/AbiGii toxin family protein [Pseudomonadota bacterium]
MREVIAEKLKTVSSSGEKYNILREYLQALVLKCIEEKRHVGRIAFVGGTALRFLFDLRRFSEDLDFSLVRPEGFDFEELLADVGASFEAWNIVVEFKSKAAGAVVNSFLKFPDLMFENGLAHRRDQKLFIKLEIDCNPPEGFTTGFSFNQKYLPMNIFHYDLPSMFAGKLHAILLRQFTKGRDFFDLMWFLGKKVEPNLVQLENAIRQTTGEDVKLTPAILRESLKKRISEADFKKIRNELVVFAEDKDDVKYVTRDALMQLVGQAM